MNSLLERIYDAVTHVGHTFDTLNIKKFVQAHVFVKGPYILATDQSPYIGAKFPVRLIIYKPLAREVDCEERPCLDERNTG